MKPRDPILLVALLALSVIAGGDRVQSGPAAPLAAHENTTMPAFAAGQILNLDPTGKFNPAQHAADVQAQLGEAGSQSSEGLVMEKSKVAGGGVMVDLQGRYQSAMTMTIDANGNVTESPCVPSAEKPANTTGKVK